MKDTNLIIGKKNTGKTRKYLFNEVEKAIQNNKNLCIFNTRDEYFKTFSKKLKNNNYNVLTLNINDAINSNGYNPLQVPYELYKEGKKDQAISLVNDLALEIFKEDNPNVDPFWQNMASSYFVGIALILFNEYAKENINLGSIQTIMSHGEEKYEDTTYLQKYLANIEVTNVIYTMLSPLVFAPSDTRGSIITVCKEKLNTYMYREELLNMLNTNDINIRNLKEKTAIIIIASKTTDLANIFIDQLIKISNLSFTYILDNFDSLRILLSLKELLDNATYNKNKVYVAVHNLEEFKELYGKYIEDKFENIIMLTQQSIDASEIMELGNDDDYPKLIIAKHEYANFKQLIDNK